LSLAQVTGQLSLPGASRWCVVQSNVTPVIAELAGYGAPATLLPSGTHNTPASTNPKVVTNAVFRIRLYPFVKNRFSMNCQAAQARAHRPRISGT
jgi:hypothetical protein